NKLLTGLVARLFGDRLTDMLSGYRAFSRRFVKSFPARASGFETEVELTVHALEHNMTTTEIQTPFIARSEDQQSILTTVRDSLHVLGTTSRLASNERPLIVFGAMSGAILLGALAVGTPGALVALSGIAFAAGVILETVNLGRRETKRLAYNGIEGLAAKLDRLEETRLTLTSLRSQVLADNPAAPTGYIARRRRTH
ncbi:MAG: hypothetical protein ABMA14_27615, partial [Hyphomonadaceae bacterium]